jgi:hypothetical protein
MKNEKWKFRNDAPFDLIVVFKKLTEINSIFNDDKIYKNNRNRR